jgi:hypothetical protein
MVLEVLGDQRIPREGEMLKRFRDEADFLVRALVDFVSQSRSQIGRLEREFGEPANARSRNAICREVFLKRRIK